jgi:hypothetical protein
VGLHRKIVTIKLGSDSVLLNLAYIAARQGFIGNVKDYLQSLGRDRNDWEDVLSIGECVLQFDGALDRSDELPRELAVLLKPEADDGRIWISARGSSICAA